MKNNIFRIVFFAVILIATSSCVDLDTVPLNSVTSLTYWNQSSAAIETVNSCYQWIGSAIEIIYNDGATDNAYVRSASGQDQSLGNGSYDTADPYVKSYWSNRYYGIKMCNNLTDNIHLVPGLTDALRNRLTSEARVIRALHYFELTSRFGAVPYFTSVISIAEAASISRTDHETVIANILNELDDVTNNHYLPNSYGTTDYGRITHWAAMALKARILLSEGRYAEVKTVTQDIITNGGYQLHPVYEQLFQPAFEKNKEIMLDVQYALNLRENQGNYQFLPPSLAGIANIVPTQELVNSYIMLNGKGINEVGSGYDPNNQWINRDPRFQMTICVNNGTYTKSNGTKVTIITDPTSTSNDRFQPGTSVITTTTGYYFKKYYDNTATTAQKSGLNFPIIRYAEVLLMYAEACSETNTLGATEWNNTIKKLRVRAGFTDLGATEFPTGKTQSELIEIVRNERRVELVMEGLRLQDIFRWKIADKVLNGNIHGEFIGLTKPGTEDGFYIVEKRVFKAEKHYLWPIPQAERDINANLGQNPNW